MATSITLPDALVSQARLRAERYGLRLEDAVANWLQLGMASITNDKNELMKSEIVTDPVSGLPTIIGGRPALPGNELTPDRVAQILHEQDMESYFAASR